MPLTISSWGSLTLAICQSLSMVRAATATIFANRIQLREGILPALAAQLTSGQSCFAGEPEACSWQPASFTAISPRGHLKVPMTVLQRCWAVIIGQVVVQLLRMLFLHLHQADFYSFVPSL